LAVDADQFVKKHARGSGYVHTLVFWSSAGALLEHAPRIRANGITMFHVNQA